MKELKEEHDGLEAASSDQVEVAAKFQKMALSMEEDIEAQKDEIQILHAAIEEHKEELTRQVAENDVLKEKEIILQNQIQKQAHDFKNQQTEFEVCFSQFSQSEKYPHFRSLNCNKQRIVRIWLGSWMPKLQKSK